MQLEITYYANRSMILHQEINEYQYKSQALEHIMRYISLAIVHNVERFDLGENVGYAFRRNGELLVLLYK
ncbi:hypothetical protein SEA_NICEHOUSE_238 [Rhodococcus phage NiceHouse]|nr:hypothetical protein SEA_NICEHOUSE_238 [Rhodococcus phage NiceHouse]